MLISGIKFEHTNQPSQRKHRGALLARSNEAIIRYQANFTARCRRCCSFTDNPFALSWASGFFITYTKRGLIFVNSLPVIDMVATGQNIAELREEAGFSVRQLQLVMGFSTPQAIYKWQRGESMPSLDNLTVLAAVLKVKLDDIIICKFN